MSRVLHHIFLYKVQTHNIYKQFITIFMLIEVVLRYGKLFQDFFFAVRLFVVAGLSAASAIIF